MLDVGSMLVGAAAMILIEFFIILIAAAWYNSKGRKP